MLIQYRVKNVYGIERMYLADHEMEALWRGLSGQITISPTQMEALRQLTGCAFEQII